MKLSSNSLAIIGYAARLPGAANSDAAWSVLRRGSCTVDTMPQGRWSEVRFHDTNRDRAGTTYVNRAGTLEDPFVFDAGYFGISPREALQMDPQQRILLEVVAQAFDHAGIDPAKLGKERTGVYVGASAADHSTTALQDSTLVEAHYMLGNTLSILANRISYTWDLHGPSFTVDTACSSSLVALDLARRAIASGEIDTAVVAGVNLLLSPLPFIGFSRAGMLSPDGLCKAFAKDGNGYVRSEGAVVFILRRSDLAIAQGDHIRSELVATGVNTDGRTAGVVLPSSERQAELIESIIADFDIAPDDLAYLEAHGTGTEVGDPLEALAIGRAYGQKRSTPLMIGSAKTNFGHLEPASGLVGLLKAQMVLEHGVIPASLHAKALNPNIDFEALNIRLARVQSVIPARDRPWYAAVNSFGFGGANAHAVIRQPGHVQVACQTSPELPQALRITAASPTALCALAQEWRDLAQHENAALSAQVLAANTRLPVRRHRLCLAAGSAETLRENLSQWLTGNKACGIAEGTSGSETAAVGFVFSGNGAQWEGMGRHLYATDPVFRDGLDRISALFVAQGGINVSDHLMQDGLEELLSQAVIAQPLLFAIQVALVDALAAFGLKPQATLGHSVGEVAAAYAAGKITLETGVLIIHRRSRTLSRLAGSGTMAALAAGRPRIEALIADLGVQVDIAADNTSANVTVSGADADIRALVAAARKARIAGKMLSIGHPYHSRMVDPLRDEMYADLSQISGHASPISLYSGCLATRVEGEQLDADYWWRNARDTVQFRAAVQAMARDGISMFVEISPRSILQANIRDNIEDVGLSATVIGSLETGPHETRDARTVALAALAGGAQMQQDILMGAPRPFRERLPAYPFDKTRYELKPDGGIDLFGRTAQHVLLGGRLSLDTPVWTATLSLARLPWLADHRAGGRIIFPATAMLEMLIAAATQLSGDTRVELQDMEILRPIFLDDSTAVSVRVRYEPATRRLSLETNERGHWALAAYALSSTPTDDTPAAIGLCAAESGSVVYQAMANVTLDYGPHFALVAAASRHGQRVDAILADCDADDGFHLNPMRADAGLHALILILDEHGSGSGFTYVPARMGRVRLFGAGPIHGARVALVRASLDGICADVAYVDATGAVVATIDELRLRPAAFTSDGPAALWDEQPVPVATAALCDLRHALAAQSAEDGAEPDDLTVLREALAGRLAWDRVTASALQDDAGNETALGILAALGVEKPGNGDCPWPDMDTLLSLLVQVAPGAQDDLFDILDALEIPVDAPPVQPPARNVLSQAALAVLRKTDLAGLRVLTLGQVDTAIVERLARDAGHVMVAGADQDRVQALSVTLPDDLGVRIGTIEQAQSDGGFDLVIGIDMTTRLAPAHQAAAGELLRKGGALLSVEPVPDYLALLARRQDRLDALERFQTLLAAQGCIPQESAWVGAGGVRFISATRTTVPAPAAARFDVSGQGALADGLRALSAEQGQPLQVRVFTATGGLDEIAMRQSEAFRDDAARSAPCWIIQEGLDGGASLKGWRRAVVNETGRDIRTLCVAPGTSPRTVADLIATSAEQELMLNGEDAQSTRVKPVRLAAWAAGAGRMVLTQDRRGSFERLEWRSAARQDPLSDQVEIEVAATGLNFRDVMWAQGLLPPEALENGFAGATLGMECSGTVTRAGPQARFAPGDRVLAFAPAAFASHVTVSSASVMALPGDIDLIQAASIPVTFFTADYSLVELAQLAPGETVLIHGGAGGVGLAAIQIAKAIGARIIATSGSPQKRRLLRAIGADHVLNNRTLAFADQVMQLTGGRGVDVVLNSLAGEAMEKTLACLAPFGRFIELGKKDFYMNSALSMRPLRNNIAYFGVDVDQLLHHRPAAADRVMRRVVTGFANRHFEVPPVRIFPGAMVGDAFRLLQRSGHIGKVLVTPPAVRAMSQVQPRPIRGAWLVTGGTSGFSLETAKWLAGQGADTLWLISRSGVMAPEDQAALVASGIRVEVRAVDVTDRAAMGELMDQIAAAGQGLSGIVHAAMVLEDDNFANLSQARLRRVIAPKLEGAIILDDLSTGFDLDHFWMFGSVAARFGSMGQSSYVAANMGLEEIACNRRARGLPGLTIAWGPIADVGLLTRHDETRQTLERQFGTLLTAKAALDSLGQVLACDPDRATITIAPMNWGRQRSNFAVIAGPLFECVDDHGQTARPGTAVDIRKLVAERGETKAREFVRDLLVAETAAILRIAPSEIDPERPLLELGFDSLMAVNLKLSAEEYLGVDLPMSSIADGLSLSKLAFSCVTDIVSGTQQDIGTTMEDRHLTSPDISADFRQEVRRKVSAA